MFDDFNICPYTGLRSFTEEESIYFKGRDEHIKEATAQLEKNKFLMLTGASGDGKSSLVYAGIIPNARSGFLKATYSNWQVIDFRPERSPLQNLCKSVARGLNIDNTETIKAELEHGFSALIDLYRSSKRYIDESTNEWKDANEKERAALTRDASNLIILADQFEEFFTNPENYHVGAPSVEASLVLNLLLETARIALEENLPIYVVFTMRSDYIGQCAAFRGLPEYIGFSQFFVPRMNRKQLQEVIEEPAVLSGNKITRRLTERLIEDITDGTDQLPMLQHGLNQIWKMADSGKEEMDLIHYAMVGGIADNQLPDDEQQKFIDWFNEQPKKIQICYDKASLQNVLNTHANKLNNHAADYVANNSQTSVNEEDAKLIIESTFKCLTKINEGRAVRNRMTLAEITQIINKPGIDTKTVNTVLNVYRDHTNTLLKPFIGEENEGWDIVEDEVLDITHESLIRNWTRLDEWAKSEVDDYTIYLDFNKQLQRWIENDHSSDFLLSIGQLTYFETWFNKKEPNEYWIARYESDTGHSKLESAAKVLTEAKAFLKSSARSHIVTRTVMRYGPKRIAAVIGVIVFLILSSFTIKTYLDRTDSNMRKFLLSEMERYANDSTVAKLNVVGGNVEQLRLEDVTPDEIANRILNYKKRVDILNNTASWMLINAAGETSPEIIRFFVISDSTLDAELTKDVKLRDNEFLLKENNDLVAVLSLSYHYTPSIKLKSLLNNGSKRAAELVRTIVSDNEISFGSANQLNTAIEFALNANELSKKDIKDLLSKLSPFETDYNSNSWLNNTYPKSGIYEIGANNEGFNFNGLYQEVAYLYAAMGNINMTLQATDSLLFHNNDYPNESYFDNANNAINVAEYFIRNNYLDEYYQYIASYCRKENISSIEYYQLLMARSLVHAFTAQKLSTEGVGFFNKYHNSNLDFIDQTKLSRIAVDLRKSIQESNLSQNEKDFLMAKSYKNEGLKLATIMRLESRENLKAIITPLFDKSFDLFISLPEEFLLTTIPSVGSVSSSRASISRKQLFLYPDIMETFLSFQAFFGFRYSSPVFLEYIIETNKIEKYYRNNISLIDDWYTEYQAMLSVIGFIDVVVLPKSFSSYLMKTIDKLEVEDRSKLSLMYLTLGNDAFSADEIDAARAYYKNIDIEVLIGKFQFFGFFNNLVMLKISHAVRDLYRYGKIDIANGIVQGFNNPINRSSIYAMAAKEGIKNDGKHAYIDQLIDSSYAEMYRVKNTDSQPNKNLIAAALAFRNKGNDIDEAIKVIKNERRKANGIWWISRGLAFNNDLYRSYDVIPNNLSNDDVCGYLFELYHDYDRNNRPESAYWKKWENFGDNSDTRIFYTR